MEDYQDYQNENEFASIGMQQYPTVPYGFQKSEKGDLLDKINPDEIVERLRHYLMGEIKENGEWVKKDYLQKHAVTEIGAWELSNLILSVSNRNTSISRLSDQEIRIRAYEVTRTAVMKMISNYREYGIKNSCQLDYLAQIIFSIVFITLKQPEGGGIRDLIKGTRTETHNVVESVPQSKGFMSRIFGRK